MFCKVGVVSETVSVLSMNQRSPVSWWNCIDSFLDDSFTAISAWEVTRVLSWSVCIPQAAGHFHDRVTHTHTHFRQRTNLHSIFSHLSARQPSLLRLCLQVPVCLCVWRNMILADKPEIDFSFTFSHSLLQQWLRMFYWTEQPAEKMSHWVDHGLCCRCVC